MANSPGLDVLCVGVEDVVQQIIDQSSKDARLTKVVTAEEFSTLLKQPPAETYYRVIVCGPNLEKTAVTELAQSLHMVYEQATLIFTTCVRPGYDRKALVKNGFSDAFLFPFDTDGFRQRLEDELLSARKERVYRPVRLPDMTAATVLNFNTAIFMPMNRKYVHFSSAGDTIDEEKLKRLQEAQVNALYIASEDMGKFYDYAANRLIELGSSVASSMPETERVERLQAAVRDLFTSVFSVDPANPSEEGSAQLLKNAEEIVKTYILNTTPADWYARLQRSLTERSDVYSHASAVSTFAALFSIGLQIGRPEELAVAGMFHDLGMADIPDAIAKKTESERTEDEKKLYETHPDLSMKIIQERKLAVPLTVQSTILQHHERWNGKGFPKGLEGSKIMKEARILALADQFDYLTQVQGGRKRCSPEEAIRIIEETQTFDPEFLTEVRKLVSAEQPA